MISTRHSLRDVRGEHGGVLVMTAVFLPVLILFITFVVDVGNWFEHKRHLQLQADAGALAGAGRFVIPGCDDNAIEPETRKYGGDPNVLSAYNLQVKRSDNVHLLINSIQYWNEGGTDHSDGGGPCAKKWVDVKLTQANLPWFFGAHVVPAINAHARVEIRQITQRSGALPVSVPDVNPTYAFATFVDETSINTPKPPVAGCPSSCTVQLTKGASSGGLVTWSAPTALDVPIASSQIGVRIRLVGGFNQNATCGQVLVECYDLGSANGVLFVRGYPSTGGTSPANPPTAGDVQLVTGTCNDPYFTSKTTSCTVGVHAKVAFPNGVGPSANCTQNPQINGACLFANGVRLTFNAGTGYWDSTGGNFINVAPGSGPTAINLHWQVKQTGITINGNGCGNGQGCQGDFTNAQRVFAAADDRSGPIKSAYVSKNGSQWQNSFATGTTQPLAVTIQIKGNLQNAADASDPPVLLKVSSKVSGSGSQTQAINCDPDPNWNLEDELMNGCRPEYVKNTGTACPLFSELWTTNQPWNCVKTKTGGSNGQVYHGMNGRILGDKNTNTCTAPNNWSSYPNIPDGDRRVVPIFMTPFGTFTGSGNDIFPVIDFGYFYVTGWGPPGNGGQGDPCAGADAAPAGYIVGHFIKYVDKINPGTGSQLCDFSSFGGCVAVMTD